MHETSGGGWCVSILYPTVPYILAQIQELEIAIDWEGARSSGKASIRGQRSRHFCPSIVFPALRRWEILP